jgi:hypothetical protein
MASFQFNAAAVDGSADFTPIPQGEYQATIVDSGLDKNDKGTEQIKLVYRIAGGPFDGRQLSQWYTVRCNTQAAVDIGMRQLKGVCEAIALPGFRDTTELHGRGLIIKVGERKNGDKTYADVKGVAAAGGQRGAHTAQPAAPAAAPAATKAAAPAAPAAGRKPWEK